MKLNVLLMVFLVLSSVLGGSLAGGLRKNFYRVTCPRAEDIVREVTSENVAKNPALPAKLLRMHFHDCFVRGCDGSVLLNSTATTTAEKDAIPNQTLSGFDAIDAIKEKVESECPGVVSCADILALAARDSIRYKYNKKDVWEVLTGRRDGRVSLLTEALANIPSPFSNFTRLKQNFANKGLNVHDLVVLSGGHTIGLGHCNAFTNRLYNFTGKGDQDPSLDPIYAAFLKSKCAPNDRVTTVEMDPNSSLIFDSNYYKILKANKGLFQSDAALLTNRIARSTVEQLVHQYAFFKEFAQSMKRMGAVEVLTGTAGEIRKKCWVVNS
ncbi:hypothetical protein TIFTF001_020901 [Ficus carica]|uniref:Peroxidase n=1 Tax=Ficus carica TaxID=3494 RepID=A0AA88DD37_FICCA|nr:hypothetical protein TIFTF001_020901 [Ficus carica]